MPTEISDAMIDDVPCVRHAVQEGGSDPLFHSAVSVPIVYWNVLSLVFSVKIVYSVDMDKSDNSKMSFTVILPSSYTVRRRTVVMGRHF